MANSKDKLLELFASLNAERQASLLDYAAFLQSKGDLVSQEMQTPVSIDRPSGESVVGAIKRLKLTYPMIGSMSVFSDASSLMTEHMVNGRDSVEVIDEMEVLFEVEYKTLIEPSND